MDVYTQMMSKVNEDINRKGNPEDYEIDLDKLDILDVKALNSFSLKAGKGLQEEEKVQIPYSKMTGFHRFSIGYSRRYENDFAMC